MSVCKPISPLHRAYALVLRVSVRACTWWPLFIPDPANYFPAYNGLASVALTCDSAGFWLPNKREVPFHLSCFRDPPSGGNAKRCPLNIPAFDPIETSLCIIFLFILYVLSCKVWIFHCTKYTNTEYLYVFFNRDVNKYKGGEGEVLFTWLHFRLTRLWVTSGGVLEVLQVGGVHI